jgi:predicted acetyltransferase
VIVVTSAEEDDRVQIRPLRGDDDLDAQLDLSERAFGTKSGDERTVWRQLTEFAIGNGASTGVFADGRPVGSACYFPTRQWWYGRAVPMAAVAGVKVAPEDRGRGIGRRMMSALLGQIAAQGFPLSVLYPATTPIYRSLGWELAGGTYYASIPARSLRPLIPPDVPDEPGRPSRIRRAGPGDAASVIDVIGRVHEAARHSGPMTWDAVAMAIVLGRPAFYSYLCDDGFTTYRWHNGNDDLFVAGVHAASAETLRELWSVIASHASTAHTVHAWINPADPLWWLTKERDGNITSRLRWMLRVVDAPAAIAGRGFPPAVQLSVPLLIDDQARPANSGRWLLSVADGKGELTRDGTGRPPLMLGTRGLAALYAGTPMTSLRLAGLAAGGDPDADPVLDAAFAATPFLLDAF